MPHEQYESIFCPICNILHIPASQELAVAPFTVSVKSAASTARRGMFDLKYHEQTAHSVSLQGSAPLTSHRGHSALTWTRHMVNDDTVL